jgi:hypothetical protein
VNINRAWENVRKKYKIPPSHLKRVLDSANGSSMKCGLVNKVRNLQIKRSALNCDGCRIQAKIVQKIWTMSDEKLVDTSRKNLLEVSKGEVKKLETD